MEKIRPSDVTHHMIITNHKHRRMIEKKLEGSGLHRAQHRLLMTLACGKFKSQVELANRMEVTPATIAVSLKTMEREGLVLKTTTKEDSRVKFVELSEEGKKIVEESHDFFDSLDQEMYRGFSEEDMKQLCDYLDRIYANMEKLETKYTTGGNNGTL